MPLPAAAEGAADGDVASASAAAALTARLRLEKALRLCRVVVSDLKR